MPFPLEIACPASCSSARGLAMVKVTVADRSSNADVTSARAGRAYFTAFVNPSRTVRTTKSDEHR